MLTERWQQVRRVLVIRLDNIGDVILLSPSLRAIRQALPQASITLLASPAGSQVAPLLPCLDEVIVHRAVWQDVSGTIAQDFEREMALVDELRHGRFDAAIIFTSFSQSPYPPAHVCYLAGIPIRLGQSREFGGNILSHWVQPRPDDLHQAERNLHLLEAAGFPVADRHLALHLPPPVQQAADELLRQHDVDPRAPFILLAPGASCPARRYDPGRFAEVARLLVAEKGWPLVITGRAGEEALAAPILAATHGRGVVSLVGRTSVGELAALVQSAACVIANDSAAMHMADALNRPVVALYSGTEYLSQWRPRQTPARLLQRPTLCSPCYRFECPYHMECLDIPPQEVVAAVLSLVDAPAGTLLASPAFTVSAAPPAGGAA